jgi:hypothetical protein
MSCPRLPTPPNFDAASPCVVKHGWLVNPLKGENILYVSERTSLLVPRLYAIYQQDDAKGRKCTYIVMEHIDGRTLSESWNALQPKAKEAITSQMRGSLDQPRCLPSSDSFGSLDNRPRYDGLFVTEQEQPAMNGPFKTDTEVIEALVLKLEQEGDSFPAEKSSYYRHIFRRMASPRSRMRTSKQITSCYAQMTELSS